MNPVTQQLVLPKSGPAQECSSRPILATRNGLPGPLLVAKHSPPRQQWTKFGNQN